jgi:cytochrome oxidase Cu insertion factor (SCO1/SenC/PrrC family)
MYPELEGMKVLLLTALALPALAATFSIADIDGRELTPLRPTGVARVLFFITNDCPISNFYAPEIQRICGEYGGKSVSCAMVYVDPTLDTAAVRRHLHEFNYKGIPAILDAKHKVVEAAGAKVTPQAVVIAHDGSIPYSGRIDNFYAGLGKPRRQATVHDLRTALEEMLAGKPVTMPRTTPVGCFIPPADIANSFRTTP